MSPWPHLVELDRAEDINALGEELLDVAEQVGVHGGTGDTRTVRDTGQARTSESRGRRGQRWSGDMGTQMVRGCTDGLGTQRQRNMTERGCGDSQQHGDGHRTDRRDNPGTQGPWGSSRDKGTVWGARLTWGCSWGRSARAPASCCRRRRRVGWSRCSAPAAPPPRTAAPPAAPQPLLGPGTPKTPLAPPKPPRVPQIPWEPSEPPRVPQIPWDPPKPFWDPRDAQGPHGDLADPCWTLQGPPPHHLQNLWDISDPVRDFRDPHRDPLGSS